MSLSQIPTSITSHALKIILEKAGVTVNRELTQLESFGYFLEEYVIQGAELTTETNSYTVSNSVISFEDTLWSVPVYVGTTALPDATYYVSFTTDGIVSDLALPTVPYLPLWELTTDSNGDILTAEDKRGDMNYVRFKVEVLGLNPEIIEAALQATQDALDAAIAANTAAEDVIGAIDAAYTAASAADSATATANAAEVVRASAETDRVNAEDLREAAESGRASAESARVLAESSRDSAEQTRDDAESNRILAETDRVNAEGLRASAESTRATDETARQSAESARASAESNRVTAESGRVTAEENRVSAESSRENAEGARVSAESTRDASESIRVAAESGRATAETTRQNNESTRQSQESARQMNTTNAINQLTDTNDEFVVWEPYDNAKAYKPLNKVSYNGSSYVCKLASTGNLPTNTSYWLLVAQRGVDGTGSTSSVNNKFPDVDGNVELTAADVGAETPAGAQTKANAAETVAKNYADTGLGNKVDKEVGKGLSSEDYTAAEKSKLANIEPNANNYEHPTTHPPSIIVQDSNNRFMTDAEKTKLSGIAAGAQVNTVNNVAGKTGNVTLVKDDVGLSSVQDYPIASQAQAETGTTNTVYMTPLRTKQYTDTRLQNDMQFRVNAGSVEYSADGLEWLPVGGGTDWSKLTYSGSFAIVAGSETNTTVREVTSGSGYFSVAQMIDAGAGWKGRLTITVDGEKLIDNKVMSSGGIGNYMPGVWIRYNTSYKVEHNKAGAYSGNPLTSVLEAAE